jgi:tetratricopeptide (TPR) repeat protein
MTVRVLRAAVVAVFLGAAAAVAPIPAAQAQSTVSAHVGTLLQEAQAQAKAGNWRGAMAKVNEAEAAPNKTAADTDVISKMKNYIAVSSGDASIGGAAGAKAKFANDYNAGKYRDVIADADALKKYNAFGAQEQLLVGQAYYKAGDFAGCVRYSKTIGGSDTALELLARCAYEVNDEVTQRQALEQLVARGGKPEHWKLLLKLGERARGLSDHNTLDINRLRLLTGGMSGKDDYISLGQFAMQFTFFAEAQAAMEKGVAAKVLTDDRSLRLLATAKAQAAVNLANEPKKLAAANAAPQGDELVTVGENMIGEGKAKDAIGVIQNGMKKPLKDANNAQLRLGQAYLAAGQKTEAKAAFAKVKTPEKDAMVAHLWTLAAR